VSDREKARAILAEAAARATSAGNEGAAIGLTMAREQLEAR
jgi:hypothetical protein